MAQPCLSTTHTPATTPPEWDDQSDLGLSWSDSDSYSDEEDYSVGEDLIMPFAGKRSREMTLGGYVFNSSQLTANPVLEHSLHKLLATQAPANPMLPADGFSDGEAAEAKRTKSPQAVERDSTVLKDLLISVAAAASTPPLPAELKRVTSTPAMESLSSNLEAGSSSQSYQYSTEMNVEDIMAMRNLTREHGGRKLDQFTKIQSLSAPDLTKSSFFACSKQMEELEEEDSENSESECDEEEGEGESTLPKPHRRLLASDFAKTSPDDYLQTTVKDTFGISPEKVPSSDLNDYFIPITPDMISSYDMEVATAVRSEDMRALTRMHRKGKTLQCCNRFGESILHTVCRRGSTQLLQFLLERAQVSMKVKCDYGRTPLHDACWTREPNFDLISIVLEECPDFLWMTDKRGFTPLNYVQRDQWGIWCVFLDEHKFLLKPKVLA